MNYNSNNSNSNINGNINNNKNKINDTKQKNEPIKVYIRLRPLLQHEDVEFWKIDEHTNNIYTVK
jgi:hypothetical protein